MTRNYRKNSRNYVKDIILSSKIYENFQAFFSFNMLIIVYKEYTAKY